MGSSWSPPFETNLRGEGETQEIRLWGEGREEEEEERGRNKRGEKRAEAERPEEKKNRKGERAQAFVKSKRSFLK